MSKIKVFLAIALGLWTLSALAQSDSSINLEKERLAQLQKIEETNRILSKQQGKLRESMASLLATEQQIEQRNALMLTLSSEVTWLSQRIGENELVITDLAENLEELKDEYAAMIYFSSKSGNALERLSYLFSSETVNQFVARVEYLKQYQKSRQQQMKAIASVKEKLSTRQLVYKEMEEEKRVLLDSLASNDAALFTLQAKQEALVKSLKQREAEIRKALEQHKQQLQELEAKIQQEVEKQMVMSESGEVVLKETPNASYAASRFEETKGYLSWPVKEGFISGRFGKHPHPVLEDIWVENNGVDIRTNENAGVYAVYPGKVVLITKVPGMHFMVLVQHGNYFTAYSRLKEVSVELNANVLKGETLGIVATNEEGISEVQFQIWKNQQKVNPAYWLTK